MNVLLWHLHGARTTAFVQGGHTHLVPVPPDRGPDGRARAYRWPDPVVEVRPDRLAGRDDVTVVHVAPFNELFQDTGRTRTTVVEHGVPEPGHRYTGELDRSAIARNDRVRRRRVTGTGPYRRFAGVVPLDVFGMGSAGLPGRTGPPADRPAMHRVSTLAEAARWSITDRERARAPGARAGKRDGTDPAWRGSQPTGTGY